MNAQDRASGVGQQKQRACVLPAQDSKAQLPQHPPFHPRPGNPGSTASSLSVRTFLGSTGHRRCPPPGPSGVERGQSQETAPLSSTRCRG